MMMIQCLILPPLILSSFTASMEEKCVELKLAHGTGSFQVCNNADDKWEPPRVCCYNAELDYHYCCTVSEYKNLRSHSARIGGAWAAITIIIIIILLLCIFSKRCPLRRAILKRWPRPEVSSENQRI